LFRDGETGCLVEAENPRALADRLLDLAGDPAARRAIGERARANVVQTRDWNRIVAGYADIYRQMTL
jgi:glycosyltransferase involved in cell wall biosynthesis